LAQALNRPFVIVESNKNNIDMQNRNLGDTQTAIDVVTALLNQIFTLENEVLQQPATLKEMEDFLANFQRGFADGQLQLTAIAMAGDILAMIANNPNLAVEEIKNGLKKKRKDLEARAESIRDSLAGLRAGGATVRIYDHNGDTAIYHAVRANDPGSLSGGPGFPVQYKQDAIRSVLIDPRAVCLFNIGNHYMAIQRHIPV
ncbi:MAG: hypothetical protein LBQ23_00435, partial [Puniceicoccales bacterium]|nr:hypothetical protein [Puniceicoccales bacterium]